MTRQAIVTIVSVILSANLAACSGGGSSGPAPAAASGGSSGAPGSGGAPSGGAPGTGGASASGGSAGGAGAPPASDASAEAAPSGPGAGDGARIVVAAGEHDRERTVVSFPLGTAQGGKPLSLEDEAGKRLPLQVDDKGRAVFILPSLKAGAQATFTVRSEAAPAGAAVKATRGEDTVAVSVDAREVFRYQMKGKLPAGVGDAFLRGGYLHPITTPAGVLVSGDYPGDHRHHHGLWSAWASTTFEGRHIDFWNMGGRSAKVDFESVGATWDGPVHGGLRTQQVHVSLAGGPKTALNEEWLLTVYRVAEGQAAPPYFIFDLDSTQQAASASPVMLEKYIYGGFALRGHASWAGGGGAQFLTAEGRNRGNGDGTSTRWCHIGGRVEGAPVGYAALIHPTNFRAPQPVRINPTDPFFSIAPVASSGFTIEQGKPYVSRYRIVVADGPADAVLLERLWKDYAMPPTVTVSGP